MHRVEPRPLLTLPEVDPHGLKVTTHDDDENGVARSTVYDGSVVASSIANDEEVQTEAHHQCTVVEHYRKLQNACKESINGPSDDVNSNPKMVDDKEQDPASRIAEGCGEEAIILDQSQRVAAR